MGSSYYEAEEALYEEAATQGQTVLVASGDNGSEACVPDSDSDALAVNDPASAPMVTAVGGTASDTADGPSVRLEQPRRHLLQLPGHGLQRQRRQRRGGEHDMAPARLPALLPAPGGRLQPRGGGLPGTA